MLFLGGGGGTNRPDGLANAEEDEERLCVGQRGVEGMEQTERLDTECFDPRD